MIFICRNYMMGFRLSSLGRHRHQFYNFIQHGYPQQKSPTHTMELQRIFLQVQTIYSFSRTYVRKKQYSTLLKESGEGKKQLDTIHTLINFKLIAFMSSTQGQQTIPCDQKMDQVVKICFLKGFSNSHKSSTISSSLKMTWWYYLLYSLMFAHFLQFLKEKCSLKK